MQVCTVLITDIACPYNSTDELLVLSTWFQERVYIQLISIFHRFVCLSKRRSDIQIQEECHMDPRNLSPWVFPRERHRKRLLRSFSFAALSPWPPSRPFPRESWRRSRNEATSWRRRRHRPAISEWPRWKCRWTLSEANAAMLIPCGITGPQPDPTQNEGKTTGISIARAARSAETERVRA